MASSALAGCAKRAMEINKSAENVTDSIFLFIAIKGYTLVFAYEFSCIDFLSQSFLTNSNPRPES
jgi:hypothetical protein